jgi:hypothetical protein
MGVLRAISVKQPWAHAIVHLRKDVENRTRCWGHRGLTLIHASAAMTAEDYHAALQFMIDRGVCPEQGIPHQSAMERGGIIGAVDVLDCLTTRSDSPWWVGPTAYVVANPRPIPFIPCKGTVMPLFWVPPPEVQAQARRALRIPD